MGTAARAEIEHELQLSATSMTLAAQRVAELFADSRAVIVRHKVHPEGVAVTFRVRVVGFKARPVVVVWSLYSSGRPLPQEWLRNVVASTITPTKDDETLVGNFWAPEPRARGRYQIHLVVVDRQGVERAETGSSNFH